MWTGGKPPRIPKQALKKPDNETSGVAFRPTGVNAELESLKQRGLAKILNKHFTDTAQKLAEEKAAADAALADLEKRKANTSEFQVSGDGELSPLDALYVSVNNWRNDCRKKERETLLLYQRYVDKFGSTGQVRLPDTDALPQRASKSKEAQSWIVKDDNSVSSIPPPPVPPSQQQVPTMAAEIERTLDEYIQKGALAVPSVEVLGKETTFQTAREKEEMEFRNYYRKQLEKRGIDARSPVKNLEKKDTFFGPGWVDSIGPGARGIVTPSSMKQQYVGSYIRPDGTKFDAGENTEENNIWCVGPQPDYIHDLDEDDDEDDDVYDENLPFSSTGINAIDDDCSMVSGLTSIHSHITRSVIQDCERSVYEFLKEEKQYISKIMQNEEKAAKEMSVAKNAKTAKATEEAENMVKQMQDILNEYQMKNSEHTQSHEPRAFHTSNQEEKWMVYYDEFYQQEYYHECNSNRTQWDPPGIKGRDYNGGGRDGSSTSISGTNSENTGTDLSSPDQISISSSKAILLSSEDVMPEHGDSMYWHTGSANRGSRRTYESRIAQYRRKRRRERKRKIVAISFLAIFICVALFSYCARYEPAVLHNLSTSIDEYIESVMKGTNEVVKGTSDSAPPRSINVGIESESKSTHAHIQNDFKTAMLDKLPENTDTSPQLLSNMSKVVTKMIGSFQRDFEVEVVSNALSIAPRDEIVDGCYLTVESILASSLVALVNFNETKENKSGEEGILMNRPWACNIPFAYLFHSRCNRLATHNPLFDIHELVLSMLQ